MDWETYWTRHQAQRERMLHEQVEQRNVLLLGDALFEKEGYAEEEDDDVTWPI